MDPLLQPAALFKVEVDEPKGSVDNIYESLLRAMLEHRLPAGTKLGEERLAELTGASRSRIRQVLGRLAHDNLVTLIPNRGAFVASPSPEEALYVLQTRRIVEPEVAAALAENATPSAIERLRKHIEQEAAARARSDRTATIRLSGEFHVLIAQMAGNPILEKIIVEMVSRTSLIITLYDRPLARTCPDCDHENLLQCFERGDASAARDIMLHHLKHIEESLALHLAVRKTVNLEDIFGSIGPGVS
ncbi:DNA-binding transcriptional regulator, GntR family [Variovorax sp. YR266]|uniref:GntR family transcriptional regulator n=1 Tax=Variovorax sp. YR266 TaxID=1884386 RepID=UPI00089722F9|nr:GntR family transcriptional regulator [Variovorax sp. YR266]SDY33379.1 DNA-binding transcriptional regulator, GntR family [Variovorax sp. YR266]